jgi:hypothetical protein
MSQIGHPLPRASRSSASGSSTRRCVPQEFMTSINSASRVGVSCPRPGGRQTSFWGRQYNGRSGCDIGRFKYSRRLNCLDSRSKKILWDRFFLDAKLGVERLPVNLQRFRGKLPSHIADQAPAIVRKRLIARWASPCLRPLELKRMVRSSFLISRW